MGRSKCDHIKRLITLTSDYIKRLSLCLNHSKKVYKTKQQNWANFFHALSLSFYLLKGQPKFINREQNNRSVFLLRTSNFKQKTFSWQRCWKTDKEYSLEGRGNSKRTKSLLGEKSERLKIFVSMIVCGTISNKEFAKRSSSFLEIK